MTCSLLMIDIGWPSTPWVGATCGQVVLGYLKKKQIEEAINSKPGSSIPPRPLLPSCLQVPALRSSCLALPSPWTVTGTREAAKPLPPQAAAYGHGRYHSYRRQTKTRSCRMFSNKNDLDGSQD